MATIIVKDSAGLSVALKNAVSGDTIKLSAGDYSSVGAYSVKFGGSGVTITSLDPANEARLHGFTVKDSEGMTFKGLEFVSDQGTTNPYQVLNSSRITFDNVNVHGTLDGNAQNDAAGLLIRSSKDIKVVNSDFHQLSTGLTHMDSEAVVIDSNKFYEIQSDGVRGGGTSRIVVSNNVFRDFEPVGADHPDAIQFWTRNTTASATDITVSGNMIFRGNGDAVQGVFFRDQVGGLPFKNVVITDNLVVGGLTNGIKVIGATNVTVDGNTVVGLQDQASAIGLEAVAGAKVSNNMATSYSFNTNVTDLARSANGDVGASNDGGAALVNGYLATHNLATNLLSAADALTFVKAATTAMDLARQELVTKVGTSGADMMTADVKRDTLIQAGAGNDIVNAGGVGHHRLEGGDGDDLYRIDASFSKVVETLTGGYDHVQSSVNHTLDANVERLSLMRNAREGTGNELDNWITGSTGDDVLSGVGGNDKMYGGDGSDTVIGGDGSDLVAGEVGNDVMRGDAGADTLYGGAGADSSYGGAGADNFMFAGGDIVAGETIFDFRRTDGDKINVSSIDSNTVLAGNNAFAFIGASAFTKVAGQLRYEVSGPDSYVLGDINGDGMADFRLLVKGVSSFQASDFLL